MEKMTANRLIHFGIAGIFLCVAGMKMADECHTMQIDAKVLGTGVEESAGLSMVRYVDTTEGRLVLNGFERPKTGETYNFVINNTWSSIGNGTGKGEVLALKLDPK